jgi:hypothetical protein
MNPRLSWSCMGLKILGMWVFNGTAKGWIRPINW